MDNLPLSSGSPEAGGVADAPAAVDTASLLQRYRDGADLTAKDCGVLGAAFPTGIPSDAKTARRAALGKRPPPRAAVANALVREAPPEAGGPPLGGPDDGGEPPYHGSWSKPAKALLGVAEAYYGRRGKRIAKRLGSGDAEQEKAAELAKLPDGTKDRWADSVDELSRKYGVSPDFAPETQFATASLEIGLHFVEFTEFLEGLEKRALEREKAAKLGGTVGPAPSAPAPAPAPQPAANPSPAPPPSPGVVPQNARA